jgi:hypothetical protein
MFLAGRVIDDSWLADVDGGYFCGLRLDDGYGGRHLRSLDQVALLDVCRTSGVNRDILRVTRCLAK